ncbi:hypothetical protein ACLQ2E_21670 [Streptomyces lavendulocolor]
MAESEASPSPTIQIERVPRDAMPDGHLVVPVERRGKLVWLVSADDISDTLSSQWNGLLVQITHAGLWEQKWDEGKEGDTDAPPGHPH